ncbi:MAG: 4Fe-4S binding protein [Chloroflexaceae bacterium]|nr:4Fe-4S binding protein [Chloroflexaceae bacterium]
MTHTATQVRGLVEVVDEHHPEAERVPVLTRARSGTSIMVDTEKTERIRERVRGLLSEGRVEYFIGYEAGSDPLHVSPSFVQQTDEVEHLVWNLMSINNLVTYLKRYRKQRMGLLVKGCDSRSVIELLKLHQVKRENVYLLGVPCTGILDPKKVAARCNPAAILAIREDHDLVFIEVGVEGRTDEPQVLEFEKHDLLFDKCRSCDYPNPLVYDELVGDPVPVRARVGGKFEDVEHLEQSSIEERLSFWQEQFNKCIRCYACKNVCPMCFCAECLWEKRDPQWVTKYPNPNDTFTFHMIRAYHMVGRCTGCMECERVCPVDIPLGTIFKKIEKDCLELFDYQPGLELDVVPPLSTFDEGDQSQEDLLR